MPSHPQGEPTRPWRAALIHALPVAAFVLGLYVYWFAIADRYYIFLYYHDMGPRVPDTSPFSAATSSRYWMTGMVASGAVMFLYTASNWLVGRISRAYRAPAWWRVWTVGAVPLLAGVPLITMTANQPTLPLLNAAQVTLAALVGLALGVLPGSMAARRPGYLAWLAADGWGIAIALLRAWFYYPLRLLGLSRDAAIAWTVPLSFVPAALWLLLVTGLRAWRRTPVPGTAQVLVSGVSITYPLMSLLHYVSFTDGYYYITTADNFLDTIPKQAAIWLGAAALAYGITLLRARVVRPPSPPGRVQEMETE